MKKAIWILMVALMLACLPYGTASAWFGSPTAIIVDDETGEPIEGAIALAQWIKTKFNFEGGFTYVSKARETVVCLQKVSDISRLKLRDGFGSFIH